MGIILNIDTSAEKAQVSFADHGKVLHTIFSDSQKEHASFLQIAVLELSRITGIQLKDIDAVAVTSGPGSYTGLRVGLSSAKGFCYALKKPLITMNTLEVLVISAIHLFPDTGGSVLFCPMIDARRMEVFTAVYNKDLLSKLAPCALILEESSFKELLSQNPVLFFGSGSNKWETVCKHPNARFKTVSMLPEAMSNYSNKLLLKGLFADLAYTEPLYLKDFQTVIKK